MCLNVRICSVGHVCDVCASIRAEKLAMRGAVDRRPDEHPKKKSGMPNAQQKGNKDTTSPIEVCRHDFSSSSMVIGQVAGWCVGRERS